MVKVGGLAVAVAGAGFIAINLGTLFYHWAHGQNPAAMDRHYFEAELYALKPMEFFIPPPTHNLAGLAELGNFYKASAFVKGETFSPYLGVVGMVGLIWLFAAESFIAMGWNLKRSRPFPPYAVSNHLERPFVQSLAALIAWFPFVECNFFAAQTATAFLFQPSFCCSWYHAFPPGAGAGRRV